MAVWVLAVFLMGALGPVKRVETFTYPTLGACEAARQAIKEFGAMERPRLQPAPCVKKLVG